MLYACCGRGCSNRLLAVRALWSLWLWACTSLREDRACALPSTRTGQWMLAHGDTLQIELMLRTPPPNIRFVVSLRNAALPPDLSLGLRAVKHLLYGSRCARPAPPLRSEVSQQACVECTDLLHALRERHQTSSEIQMLRAATARVRYAQSCHRHRRWPG